MYLSEGTYRKCSWPEIKIPFVTEPDKLTPIFDFKCQSIQIDFKASIKSVSKKLLQRTNVLIGKKGGENYLNYCGKKRSGTPKQKYFSYTIIGANKISR
ncbi:MAG: hypothetical protein EOO52_09785 [Gammaproteobacteria bacterium]|nr:MAG: hypothetical protein EOO52_09785 [Gammaproteobacteria bacterium]